MTNEINTEIKVCRVCGDVLTEENWTPSYRNSGSRICKKCDNERQRLWAKANPDKRRAKSTRYHRKNGHLPMDDNKDCAAFLGVYVTERLLRHYFKDVEVMPYGNPGYDFICNRDKLIDAKSSCLGANGRWLFNIGRNVIADFFVCTAFDNRDDLNVLHVWMIPGRVVNHLTGTSISPSTIHKWDQYKLDVDKASACCIEMKDDARSEHTNENEEEQQ